MKTDPYATSVIDHFLQANILAKLTTADRPLRFSELKEDGIENSLFMYHANKLIDRGLVQKDDSGFGLTLKGARWVNYAGILHSFRPLTPRPLIQFLIQDRQNNLLLAVRKGRLREFLNDYLLPGDIYRHGSNLEDNVKLILQELFGSVPLPQPTLLTTADIMHTFDDGFTNHVISYIFALAIPDGLRTLDHPLFNVEWVPMGSVTLDNQKYQKSLFLPTLLARLPVIQPQESFVIENK
jgi:hypothetical protein